MEEENLVEISDEQVILNFNVDDGEFIAFTESTTPQEGDDICFAKVEILENGMQIIRSVPEEMLDRVVKTFDELVEVLGEEDETDEEEDETYEEEGDE